jgi:hypothetical protein
MTCDICEQPIDIRPEAPKWHLTQVLGHESYKYHKDCMRRAMNKIWKEIFQAQELKRKKEPLTSKNITAMMEL